VIASGLVVWLLLPSYGRRFSSVQSIGTVSGCYKRRLRETSSACSSDRLAEITTSDGSAMVSIAHNMAATKQSKNRYVSIGVVKCGLKSGLVLEKA
jgi:hypothetical protein